MRRNLNLVKSRNWKWHAGPFGSGIGSSFAVIATTTGPTATNVARFSRATGTVTATLGRHPHVVQVCEGNAGGTAPAEASPSNPGKRPATERSRNCGFLFPRETNCSHPAFIGNTKQEQENTMPSRHRLPVLQKGCPLCLTCLTHFPGSFRVQYLRPEESKVATAIPRARKSLELLHFLSSFDCWP